MDEEPLGTLLGQSLPALAFEGVILAFAAESPTRQSARIHPCASSRWSTG